MKNSISAVSRQDRVSTLQRQRPGQAAHKARATDPADKPEPGSPLTPEESAAQVRPPGRHRRDSGPSPAFVSQAALSPDDGSRGLWPGTLLRFLRHPGKRNRHEPAISTQADSRTAQAGVLRPRGRRGTTGRSRPQFAVGPRLIRYLRDYLAWKDRKQVARRNGEKVERFKANLRPAKPANPCVPLCDTRVVPLCDTRVVPLCDTRVVPLGVDNPLHQPVPRTGLMNRRDVRTCGLRPLRPSRPGEIRGDHPP